MVVWKTAKLIFKVTQGIGIALLVPFDRPHVISCSASLLLKLTISPRSLAT